MGYSNHGISCGVNILHYMFNICNVIKAAVYILATVTMAYHAVLIYYIICLTLDWL